MSCMFCFSFCHLPSPALKPSRGDGVDVDRCVNEQHDGENIRSLLHCAHVGCAGAGQFSRGIAWKGETLSHTHKRTRSLTANIFVRSFGHSFIFLFLCSLPSPTRWINMPRSCWQPWVQAWRRKTIQVTWQQSPFLYEKKKSYSNL